MHRLDETQIETHTDSLLEIYTRKLQAIRAGDRKAYDVLEAELSGMLAEDLAMKDEAWLTEFAMFGIAIHTVYSKVA